MAKRTARSLVYLRPSMAGLAPPPAPTSLAITGASGGLVADLTPTLTFTAAPTATSHKVQWSDDNFATVMGETTVAMPTAEYTHTVALSNFTAYYWRVAGINAAGQGPWSDSVSVETRNYEALVTSLSPVVWLRLQETSGNPVDSGSASATVTQANCTQNQTGILGAGEAYDFDGNTSLITVGQVAAFTSLTDYEYITIAKPDGPGEGSAGVIYRYGLGATKFLYQSAGTQVAVGQDYDGTDALRSYAAPATDWRVLFVEHDATAKTVTLRIGSGGSVTSPTPISDSTGTGNQVLPTGTNVNVGNNAILSAGFDGLIDEFIIIGRKLTPTERTQIAQAVAAASA